MLHIEISNQADADIEAIFDYYINQFGQDQTVKYLLGLDASFDLLAQNPRAGKFRKELEYDLYSFVYVSHIVFYRFNVNRLRIERVLHSSRDLTEDSWFK